MLRDDRIFLGVALALSVCIFGIGILVGARLANCPVSATEFCMNKG